MTFIVSGWYSTAELRNCIDAFSITYTKINMVMTYFVHLPSLNVELYTNYFLHTFMPRKDFDRISKGLLYIQYFKKDFCNDLIIMTLESILQKKYNFPPIEYFSIFKHDRVQPIHHDGTEVPRYASLNLPLHGFESTKMIFYKTILDVPPTTSDGNYYLPENVEPVIELEGTNEWVLIDSSIPHNITNVDFNNPRITLCIRFVSNPTFAELADKINGTLGRIRTDTV